MAEQPWFKFYATDYLLDPDVDSIPLEAQAVLLRMWCLCNIDGFCPVEPEEIARKARLSFQVVAKHSEQLTPFFELRDGRLYSRRMQEEKRKSESARLGGEARGKQLRSADRSASGSADRSTQSQSQSQGQEESPSPFLEKPFFHLKKEKNYSQKDFDERDLREWGKAKKKIDLQLEAAAGSGRSMTDEEYFARVAGAASISIERGLELEERAKKWPQSQTLGASA
jgi:uncharacterized protein YdaU (DUF1376 family)